MKTNRAGVELIKAFEGLRTTAYLCPANVWTIGYGSTSGVVKGMKITPQQADDILVDDLAKFEAGVAKVLKRVPTENQFAALVSLAFNIGLTAFAGSTVLRRFNEGNFLMSGDAFLMWRFATVKGQKVVLKGLERRRQAERQLFLRTAAVAPPIPDYIPEPTPAPLSLWAKFLALFSRG